jgi:hypothetical protein
MTVTHELHDTCIALFGILKARDPELSARALARGVPLTQGTPEHSLMLDLNALDSVASCFATGDRPAKRDLQRVEKIIAAQIAVS